MGSGTTKDEILEEKLERKLQDPKTEPLISLPRDFLKHITSNFSTEQEIGRGGWGAVYKGDLRSGKAIAVKKIFDKHLLRNDNQVNNEIVLLDKVCHQNVVQLLGYCVETRMKLVEHNGNTVMAEKHECLLCFELCNRSLDEDLSEDSLDWDMRYEIIRGVCRGLHYLHQERNIVHLDLKPQNILMDDMRMPKIADFGLSRHLGEQEPEIITENRAGTLGYMAQEYVDHGIITRKADIFSLGVMIIKIITGRTDFPNIGETTETSLKCYRDEVVEWWKNRVVKPMQKKEKDQVDKCISIALECLEPERIKRPTSLYIVQKLNAEEPNSTPPQNSPIVVEEGPSSAIKSLNECADLFDWVLSATSSPKYHRTRRERESIQADVNKLQSYHETLIGSLQGAYDLIDHAEWKTHQKCVADLLPKLKDAVYDAEDLLDEFKWYETMVSVEGNEISIMNQVIGFFRGFITQDGFNKFPDIQGRLTRLSAELKKMGPFQPIPRFETTSFPTAKVFGRDTEKKDLISRLLGVPSKNSTDTSGYKRKRNEIFVPDNEKNELIRTDHSGSNSEKSGVPVLPIVGMGGVGKTTLAQEICSDPKVKNHFEGRIIWICVSNDFDAKRLIKETIGYFCEKVPENDNLNFLQTALTKCLQTGRRFLLVLDDVWNDDHNKWKQFYTPFTIDDVPTNGSMMLVTTRSQKVAAVVSPMDRPFPLEGLKKDAFWEFFKLCAFGPGSSNNDPELEQIGKQILQKLKGSPLAAKTLGQLLGRKLDLEYWKGIMNSELLELPQEGTDILPALRLSYMHLPRHLKRCFSFCAVYPKDYGFKMEELAELWVAEGLAGHQQTGEQYFEELVHLSFFQIYPRRRVKYVIHDLMHDMAQLVSKDECFIVKDTDDLPKIPHNVRHLYVLKDGDVKCSDLKNHLCKHTKLRTLICDLTLQNETDSAVMKKWCDELLCMRVMVFSSISELGLPDSISNLKHLRYLKTLGSSKRKNKFLGYCLRKRLPAKFCCLYNLQIVYANTWVIDDFPSEFGKLMINLQKFESAKCQFHQEHGSSFFELRDHSGEYFPSWFHQQNSQPTYVSANSTSRRIEVLRVFYFPNNKSQHLFAPSLKKLYLTKSGNLGCNIQCSSLTILDLSNNDTIECIDLQKWNLPLLQVLEISSCSSLESIEDSSEPVSTDLSQAGARSTTGKFPELTHLTIVSCKELETIDDLLRSCGLLPLQAKRLGGFSHLKHMVIRNTPKLKWQSRMSVPSSLQKLELSGCGDFSAWFPSCLGNPTSLEELEICDCDCIVDIEGHLWSSKLKSLQTLKFRNCKKLLSIGGPDAIGHIKDLYIAYCPKLMEIAGQPLKKGSFVDKSHA